MRRQRQRAAGHAGRDNIGNACPDRIVKGYRIRELVAVRFREVGSHVKAEWRSVDGQRPVRHDALGDGRAANGDTDGLRVGGAVAFVGGGHADGGGSDDFGFDGQRIVIRDIKRHQNARRRGRVGQLAAVRIREVVVEIDFRVVSQQQGLVRNRAGGGNAAYREAEGLRRRGLVRILGRHGNGRRASGIVRERQRARILACPHAGGHDVGGGRVGRVRQCLVFGVREVGHHAELLIVVVRLYDDVINGTHRHRRLVVLHRHIKGGGRADPTRTGRLDRNRGCSRRAAAGDRQHAVCNCGRRHAQSRGYRVRIGKRPAVASREMIRERDAVRRSARDQGHVGNGRYINGAVSCHGHIKRGGLADPTRTGRLDRNRGCSQRAAAGDRQRAVCNCGRRHARSRGHRVRIGKLPAVASREMIRERDFVRRSARA